MIGPSGMVESGEDNNYKMIRKKIFLLTISWNIGLIALLGGWTIFLAWTLGRYVGAEDFNILEFIGFIWMFSFFWLALIALLLLSIYTFINRNNLHIKVLSSALLILINIPSVVLILYWHGKIEKKIFVKLKNESGFNINLAQLNGNLKSWKIGEIKDGSSVVFNYDPPYWNYDGRHYPKPDSLTLIINSQEKIDSIKFPTLRLGECEKLVIDKKLKINRQ